MCDWWSNGYDIAENARKLMDKFGYLEINAIEEVLNREKLWSIVWFFCLYLWKRMV